MNLKIWKLKSMSRNYGAVKVYTIVSGNFAPGDYPFDYYFSIMDGKIKTIKIIYMGE
jgi:hypothetical protein